MLLMHLFLQTMNDLPPYIIETDTPSEKNKFPIILQLGILSVIMVGIFSTWIFQDIQTTKEPEVAQVNTTVTETHELNTAPKKIDENIPLIAEIAYVWDVKNQRALFNKNADKVWPLASITKLMTTLLAHELIAENELVTISLPAILQEGSSGLAPGEQINVEQIRELALISSSNDAAYALAASVGSLLGEQDPASQFIQGMNIRADELGLNSLQFKSTTGLDLSETEPGAIGSARDVSFLMEYIITNYPSIISPTKQLATRVYNTDGAYHEVSNTNQLVQDIPNLIGSKTGFTDLAGGNLTIAFDAGMNRPIIITVLGSTHDGRFDDVMTLVKEVQNILSNNN